MELLAAGRDADVYALDGGRVLRRYRDGRSAEPEATAIAVARRAGYPTPRLHAVDGADMVLDLVPGPTLLAALLAARIGPGEAGEILADLHNRLGRVPWRDERLLHLDLHPANVILGPDGPTVIDWSNARSGPRGLDAAMTALICLQTGLAPEAAGIPAGGVDVVRASVEGLVTGFVTALDHEFLGMVDTAATLRRQDPNLTTAETELVAAACDTVRRLAGV